MTTFTLWGATVPGTVSSASNSDVTFGLFISLSSSEPLLAVRYYSGPAETSLPTKCAVFDVATQTLIAGTENDSPSWSGAAGSGWVECAYDGSITLDTRTAGYCPVVYWPSGTNTYVASVSYPVTSGVLTAPLFAVGGGNPNNVPFVSGSGFTFPTSQAAGFWWGVDIKVGTSSGPHAGSASLTGSGALGGTGQKTVPGVASLSGSGTLGGTGQKSVPGTVTASGSGSLTATGQKSVPGAAALTGSGSLTGTGQKLVPGAASLSGSGVITPAAQKSVPGAALLGGTGTLSGSGTAGSVPAALAGTGTTGATASVLYRRGASLSGSGTLRGVRTGAAVNAGVIALSARPVLTCSSLSARIVMATDTMFPANQLGTYGATEAETTVTAPGITDGIYSWP